MRSLEQAGGQRAATGMAGHYFESVLSEQYIEYI